MAMHFTYCGTLTQFHGSIFTLVPGSQFIDAAGDTRAQFLHVSGDPARGVYDCNVENMLPAFVA